MSKTYAIVRLRGRVNRSYNVEHTMKLLRLYKPNHAVVYHADGPIEGMLKKVKDAITWGEVDAETVAHLLRKRGELSGDNRLTDEYVNENTDYGSIEEFAEAVVNGEAKIADIPEIQPVFRLSPPRKGFKSLKYSVTQNGDLGYRGEKITTLISRMA